MSNLNLVPTLYNEEYENVKTHGAKGDGVTDDTAAIQAAVNALTAGDTLYFPSGIYLCDKILISGKTDVFIDGGKATLYRSVAAFAAADQNIDVVNCSGCTISGFIYDAENSLIGHNRGGVTFDGCDTCTVEKAHFKDVRTGVTTLNSNSYLTVQECTAEQQLPLTAGNESGILLMDYLSVYNGSSSYCKTINNNLDGARIGLSQPGATYINMSHNTTSATADSVIYFSGTKYFTCHGNIMHDCGKDAIKAIVGSEGGAITGNFVYGTGEVTTNSPNLIQVDASSHISITGNTVKAADSTTRTANSQYGIFIGSSSFITVTGNNIYCLDPGGDAKSEDGIRIETNGGNTNHVIVSNNNIYNVSGVGIILWSDSAHVISDIDIIGNRMKGTSTVINDYGIRVLCSNEGMSDIRILNNSIETQQHGGVYLTAGSAHTLSDVLVKGNKFKGLNANAEPINFPGDAGTVTNVRVEDNLCDSSPNAFFTTGNDAKKTLFAKNNYMDNTLQSWVISLDGTINTTPYTISGMQNGTDFDNTGASALGQFNLPAAVKGMSFTFERVASQTLRVDPNGTEYFADTGTHGYKSLDSDGAYMKIKCFKDGVWHVVASLGVISDE
jgi:hypothetical protein